MSTAGTSAIESAVAVGSMPLAPTAAWRCLPVRTTVAVLLELLSARPQKAASSGGCSDFGRGRASSRAPALTRAGLELAHGFDD